jgi:hypothetical protein
MPTYDKGQHIPGAYLFVETWNVKREDLRGFNLAVVLFLQFLGKIHQNLLSDDVGQKGRCLAANMPCFHIRAKHLRVGQNRDNEASVR